jgi:hypothetical protein
MANKSGGCSYSSGRTTSNQAWWALQKENKPKKRPRKQKSGRKSSSNEIASVKGKRKLD